MGIWGITPNISKYIGIYYCLPLPLLIAESNPTATKPNAAMLQCRAS
jgi:hypothetical protein